MYVISLNRLCYQRVCRESFQLELSVNHVMRMVQKQKLKSNFKRKKHAGALVCNIQGSLPRRKEKKSQRNSYSLIKYEQTERQEKFFNQRPCSRFLPSVCLLLKIQFFRKQRPRHNGVGNRVGEKDIYLEFNKTNLTHSLSCFSVHSEHYIYSTQCFFCLKCVSTKNPQLLRKVYPIKILKHSFMEKMIQSK